MDPYLTALGFEVERTQSGAREETGWNSPRFVTVPTKKVFQLICELYFFVEGGNDYPVFAG
jgi:hypothetical protein